MFLNKLYQYNRFLFFIVLVFLLAYGYLNYKWGISATPIQQYGMFSGKVFLKDTLQLYILKANGKLINEAALSQTERDIIQSYPEFFEKHTSTNEAIYNTVSPYFNYAGITGEKHRVKFLNNIPDSIFNKWYINKLEDIIKKPIKNIEVARQQVAWDKNQLRAIGQPLKISFIAAN